MLFIHQQIQSFLNLGACKEYPIMAKPKSPKKNPEVKASITAQNPSASITDHPQEAAVSAASPSSQTPKAQPKKTVKRPELVRAESRTSVASTSTPQTNLIPMNLEEEIRKQAYLFSERRGFEPGHEAEDWLNAEHEVHDRYHQQSAQRTA